MKKIIYEYIGCSFCVPFAVAVQSVNEMAKDGWRLIHVHNYDYLFERPVKEI